MKAGWTQTSLGDVADIIGGGTPSKSNPQYFNGAIPWATVRDMNVEVLRSTEHHISELGLANSSAKVAPAGEVVIATRVGLGKVCILAQDTAINQDLRVVIPRDGVSLDRSFLFHWFKSIAHEIVGAGTGATVQGVKLPFVKALPIPLPPLEEQQRIVAILDEAFEGLDRAKANAEANLVSARELFSRQSAAVFQQLENENEVSRVAVEELALAEKGSIRTGPFGSQLRHSEFVDDGIAVLGIDNAVSNRFEWRKRRYITEDKYRELQRYTVRPGDVIITIMGTCGRCAVVPDDIPTAINTKHLCCISLEKDKCMPKFLHRYFLHSPTARTFLGREASGSVMDGLNMGIIKRLPVHLPKLDRQAEVVGMIDELEAAVTNAVDRYERSLAALLELRQSILAKAFAGELT